LSPFLENFLIDAVECWRAGGETRARSGPWVELSADGSRMELEATALTAGGEQLLLLERLGEGFAARKSMLQTARENVIATQRLNSEIEKKEILLHCVAQEMSAALANVITSLRLLAAEQATPRGAVLVELAVRGAEEQRALIGKVLTIFADELHGIFGQATQGGAVLAAAVRRAIAATAGPIGEKEVRVNFNPDGAGDGLVTMDPEHLARVVSNALEDAIEHAPAGSEVRVRVVAEPDALRLEVEDDGVTLGHNDFADSFAPLEWARGGATPASLGLHFCRMMVEGCGGEMDRQPHESGGNRLWMRLPRVRE
jgi:signal transduction histidine kinase